MDDFAAADTTMGVPPVGGAMMPQPEVGAPGGAIPQQSQTPNLDKLSGMGDTPPASWQPKPRKNLKWLAALGAGLSGIGAAINPQGNVQQAMAPSLDTISNWDEQTFENILMQAENEADSPLSTSFSKVLGMKPGKHSFVELEKLYPALADKMRMDFQGKMANMRVGESTKKFNLGEGKRISKIYMTSIEKLQPVANSIDRLSEMAGVDLSKYNPKTHSINGKKVDDLPGIQLMKRRAATPEGAVFRDEMQNLINQLLKELSGAAVSDQEAMRQLKALGADGVLFADKRALSALKRSMEDIRGKWEAAETMLGSNPSELDRWKKEKPRLVWSTRYGSTKPKPIGDVSKGKRLKHPSYGNGTLIGKKFTTDDGKVYEVE
jgi:hypothetical protein